jgi:hypothetical protein
MIITLFSLIDYDLNNIVYELLESNPLIFTKLLFKF